MSVKHVIALSALVLMLIFVLQNMEVVSVAFLIWNLQASRIVIYLTIFLIGALIGWLGRSLKR